MESKYRSVRDLSNDMKTFRYSEFDKLMSPDQVEKERKGSCHDQVMFELRELARLGFKPKAKALIEYDDNGQGGMTHSFVYYNTNGKTVWFENAWSERAGATSYPSIDSIMTEIRHAHKTGEFGNSKKFKNLEFADFDPSDHEVGEDLQQFVDRCFG